MPPRLADLIAEIAAALRRSAPTFRYPTSIGRAYEAYCFSIVFRALQEVGFVATPQQLRGGVFVFPLGPRSLASPGSSYFRFERPGPAPTQLELHSNTYSTGISGHEHELDVAVIDVSDANQCRSNGSDLPKGGVWMAIECKCYDSNLGTGIGRSFLGLAKEMGGSGQKFVLMTSYPWPRRVVFDIVRRHGHRYYKASPRLPAITEETRHALRADLAHLVGR